LILLKIKMNRDDRIILRIFKCFLLLVIGLIIYSNTFKSTFQFDDLAFIIRNYSLRNLGDFSGIAKAVLNQPSRFVGLYSFALNYHFHQLNVFGYHATNMAIHLITTFLVWWFVFFVCRLSVPIPSSSGKSKKNTTESLIPYFAAFIFLVHPLQTQAVTYITQRFASLATLFYLASLCFYLRARIERNHKILFFSASLLSAVLGMFTKEIVITLPLMILLIEFLFFKNKERNQKHSIVLMGTLGLLFLIIPGLFSFKIMQLLNYEGMSASHAGDVLTFKTYCLTQFRVLATFLKLLFFPVYQNFDYDFPMSLNLFEPVTTFLSFSILVAILYYAVRMRNKDKLIAFSIFWFFVTLSVNFVPRQYVIFEHKLYLVSIGFCLFAAIMVRRLLPKQRQYLFVMTVFIFILSFLTYKRNNVWQNGITLWEDVVRKSPHQVRGYHNLGTYYRRAGRLKEALESYNYALSIDPGFLKGFNHRGGIYRQQGRHDLALKDYDAALEINSKFSRVYNNKGNVHKSLKDYDAALENYNKALEIDPSYDTALYNRALIYETKKIFDLAFEDYNAVLKVNQDYGRAYNNRGRLYCMQRRYALGLNDFKKAMDLEPDFQEAYFNYARTYEALGKDDLALKHYQKTLEVNPNNSVVYYNMGNIYFKKNQRKKAAENYQKALDINPQYQKAYHNLKRVLQ